MAAISSTVYELQALKEAPLPSLLFPHPPHPPPPNPPTQTEPPNQRLTPGDVVSAQRQHLQRPSGAPPVPRQCTSQLVVGEVGPDQDVVCEVRDGALGAVVGEIEDAEVEGERGCGGVGWGLGGFGG